MKYFKFISVAGVNCRKKLTCKRYDELCDDDSQCCSKQCDKTYWWRKLAHGHCYQSDLPISNYQRNTFSTDLLELIDKVYFRSFLFLFFSRHKTKTDCVPISKGPIKTKVKDCSWNSAKTVPITLYRP